MFRKVACLLGGVAGAMSLLMGVAGAMGLLGGVAGAMGLLGGVAGAMGLTICCLRTYAHYTHNRTVKVKQRRTSRPQSIAKKLYAYSKHLCREIQPSISISRYARSIYFILGGGENSATLLVC